MIIVACTFSVLEKFNHVFFFSSLSFSIFQRTIMAVLHFSRNLKREKNIDDEGQPVLHVTYPKFKEEVKVSEAKVPSNHYKLYNIIML